MAGCTSITTDRVRTIASLRGFLARVAAHNGVCTARGFLDTRSCFCNGPSCVKSPGDRRVAEFLFAVRLTFDRLLTATLTTAEATYGADEIASLTERPDIPEI